MYIEIVPNRNSPPAILPREGWREGGKVRKRTLAILSSWPQARIDALRQLHLDRLIGTRRSPERDRVLAMIVARVLEPGSRLSTARNLAETTAANSLTVNATVLGLSSHLSYIN